MKELSLARLRLEQSASFRRSGALLSLLDFLLKSAQDGPIKETWVGAEFYKREATYDPRADSIARVNVRRLRQKLEQFYATEGADEAYLIVIPTGSFTPVLESRNDGTTVPMSVTATLTIAPADEEWLEVESPQVNPSVSARSYWRYAGAGLVLVCGLYLLTGKRLGHLTSALAGVMGKPTPTPEPAVSIATVDPSPTPVGTTSQQQAVITFPARVKLNPTLAIAIQVVTQGVPNADFRYAAGGTCQAGKTYSAGESCTVNYTFSPQTAGQRKGAILLQNDSSELAPVLTKYISRTGSGRTAQVPAGMITTMLGGPADVGTKLANTEAIAIDAAGVLFVADTSNQRVIRVSNRIISQYGPEIADPTGIALDGAGNVYVPQWGASNLLVINHASGKTSVFPGTEGIHHINCVDVDAARNVYVSSGTTFSVYRIAQDGTRKVIAGTGFSGYNGDGIPAEKAQLRSAFGVLVDEAGGVYIEDRDSNRVRKITPAGIMTTVAGTGDTGFSGDGGPATRAKLSHPADQMALDSGGNLYFADNGNERLRRVSAATGIISTVVGNGTLKMVENVMPTASGMDGPTGVAFDVMGDLYLTQNGEAVVRRVAVQGRSGR